MLANFGTYPANGKSAALALELEFSLVEGVPRFFAPAGPAPPCHRALPLTGEFGAKVPRKLKTQPKGRGPAAKPKKPVQPTAPKGVKTAIDLAVAAAGNPSTEQVEEQLDIEDLIGAPLRLDQVEVLNKSGVRGVGRPVGARNKRTIEWAEYLLTRYASPLEVLAQMAVARVDVLAAQLGCTKLEAYQEKRLAAIALVPFIHQKQPLAVNFSNKTFVHLTISEESAPAPAQDDITVVARVVERIDGPNS